MAATWYSNESQGANGAAITVPASDTGDALNGASGQTVTTDAMHGSKALQFINNTGSSNVRIASGLATFKLAVTTYLKFDTAATADNIAVTFQTAATVKVFSLNRNGANKWRITDTVSSNLGTWAPTNTIPLNVYNRVEIYVDASGANGSHSVQVFVFAGDSDTIAESFSSTTASLGTVAIDKVIIGKNDTSAAGTIKVDSTGLDPAATGRIGKFPSAANVAPVASAGAAQTVPAGTQITLAGTATDSDGTIASVAWTCTGFPTGSSAPAITSPTSLTAAKVTPVDPGVYTFQLAATDNAGASSTSSVTVNVYPASGTPAKVQSVTVGSWATFGSPSSALVGLNDGLATTGLESPAGATGQPATLTFAPVGPGAVVLPISGYSVGGTVTRKIDVYKADGTTKIYDDAAFVLPTTDTVHSVTLDSAALAAVPTVADRVALVAIVKDTAS